MADTSIVYVVLFNVGTENEGIHSIRVGDQHQVLMFENEDDATRFSVLLEALDTPPPTVEKITREEIEEICQDAGYKAVLVPEGELVTPVETMVEETTWDPDADPDQVAASRSANQAANQSANKRDAQTTAQSASQTAADAEMDRIRAQLEKLL